MLRVTPRFLANSLRQDKFALCRSPNKIADDVYVNSHVTIGIELKSRIEGHRDP